MFRDTAGQERFRSIQIAHFRGAMVGMNVIPKGIVMYLHLICLCLGDHAGV